MSSHDIPDLDRAGLRRFGLTTGAIIAGLFGLALPLLLGHRLPLWPWVIFAVLGTAALLIPETLGPVYRVWMKFGALLGAINSRIILAIFFFLVIFPAGLLRRLFGGDPLRRRFDSGPSYRVPSVKHKPKDLERPF